MYANAGLGGHISGMPKVSCYHVARCNIASSKLTELQIREGIEDNSKIIFLVS